MQYTVRLSLDSYRNAPEILWDTFATIINVRAVSRRHALDKALAKAPETFRTVYYRAAFPDVWTLTPSAEIISEG